MFRVTVAALLLVMGAAACAEVLWQDDFRGTRRYERFGVQAWTLGQGRCAFTGLGGESWLVSLGPQLGDLTIEAEITITKRHGTGYALAALSLFADPANHWRLLLVEGPNGKRYCELIEMFAGEHQAQLGGLSPQTRLQRDSGVSLQTWEYGRRYKLVLEVRPGGIKGTVTDPAAGQSWWAGYAFESGKAVRTGRAAVMAAGLQGVFHKLRAEGAIAPPSAGLALRSGPLGTVVVVDDQAGTVAPLVARALEGEGYGVTRLAWDDLEQPLPWDTLDLLVLADARRVPLAARDQLVSALHSSGKVLCLGAPALAELRAKGPDGWHDAKSWLNSYAAGLPRRPIALGDDPWVRGGMNLTKASTIVADPAAGPTAWKATTDLDGWDTFRADIPGAFDADHRLLWLEARGDATTSQLSIECTEQDGARWIAVIDLTPEWQTYLLRPLDFRYWFDSTAKNRGASGDRLRPENCRSVTIGLASSHTTKVKSGPHTYWVRNLSVAEGTGLPEPDFGVPAVETLCPSYKLYPMDEAADLRPAAEQCVLPAAKPVKWSGKAYAPVWRERGRGLHRNRSWRWVPLLQAHDRQGKARGALISLTLGDAACPNAMWANVAVADPAQALRPELLPSVLRTARAMTAGCFLLDGGAELFSYQPGEAVVLGGTALNTTRQPRQMSLRVTVRDAAGKAAFSETRALDLAPAAGREAVWTWKPVRFDPRGYAVETALLDGPTAVDRIVHRIEALRATPARPEEFVRVEGSNFTLGGKPWFFKGMNYYPSWVGGYQSLQVYQRTCYDPEIFERDLTQLQAMGINALSAVAALQPPNPAAPNAYRDQLDFLQRCDRHGIKVFFFMGDAWPYRGADFAKVKEYITRAGLKDNPAVMCWELAWEPIEANWEGRLDYIIPHWNRWIVQRYGSVANACADWGFTPELTKDGQVPFPSIEQGNKHGVWDKYVAAFRRAHSDIICAGYRDIAEPLRAWDPKHLISFRGGACGIPNGAYYAHIHGTAAPKHMDFLNPEGYNLKTGGWDTPTPADDIRKGGLVTLFYRFMSREKPVVWMEFGYTANGISTVWRPELVHLNREQLRNQRAEYDVFYRMFLESGARGAAPWWWPGGFRLGENSDFGLIEPDGAERPALEVLHRYLSGFAKVRHRAPNASLELELETHYPDAWETYAPRYLALAKAGKTVAVRTAGTGTDSTTCPLLAVGGGPCNGHNPPLYLNAEFNRLEVRVGDRPRREVRDGDVVEAVAGGQVLCRASVGNLGEAAWLAPAAGKETGGVFLAGRKEYGLEFRAPIARDTPYLKDAEVAEFTLVPSLAAGETKVSLEMAASGRAHFGERRIVTFRTAP